MFSPLVQGCSRPALAFSSPRLEKIFLFGGLSQAALAFSAPRLEKIFLFGGLSRPALAFSAPRSRKFFLFGGLPPRHLPSQPHGLKKSSFSVALPTGSTPPGSTPPGITRPASPARHRHGRKSFSFSQSPVQVSYTETHRSRKTEVIPSAPQDPSDKASQETAQKRAMRPEFSLSQ